MQTPGNAEQLPSPVFRELGVCAQTPSTPLKMHTLMSVCFYHPVNDRQLLGVVSPLLERRHSLPQVTVNSHTLLWVDIQVIAHFCC